MMVAHVLTSCVVSAALLAYVWLYQISRLRRDDYRTDVRRLRDRLFDFMWQNGYDFDIPGYVETRQALNGMLRLSNHLSPLKFLVSIVFFALYDASEPALYRRVREIEDDRLRKEIEKVHRQAVRRMVGFLFLEGVRGSLLRWLVRLIGVAQSLSRVRDRFWRGGRGLLVESYELGGATLSVEERALLHD